MGSVFHFDEIHSIALLQISYAFFIPVIFILYL